MASWLHSQLSSNHSQTFKAFFPTGETCRKSHRAPQTDKHLQATWGRSAETGMEPDWGPWSQDLKLFPAGPLTTRAVTYLLQARTRAPMLKATKALGGTKCLLLFLLPSLPTKVHTYSLSPLTPQPNCPLGEEFSRPSAWVCPHPRTRH